MPLPSAGWHKSSYSGDFEDACVEVRVTAASEALLIRDSKDRSLRPVTVSAASWRTFLASHSNA
ncbi:DUF397 domain-containing protein [Streptomyces sp. NPDC047853]|uniref:DUF397 domain-containing protein n=1 Tax=unclassified Streptomyces TaxID=2593676 RepID=UPI003453D992